MGAVSAYRRRSASSEGRTSDPAPPARPGRPIRSGRPRDGAAARWTRVAAHCTMGLHVPRARQAHRRVDGDDGEAVRAFARALRAGRKESGTLQVLTVTGGLLALGLLISGVLPPRPEPPPAALSARAAG